MTLIKKKDFFFFDIVSDDFFSNFKTLLLLPIHIFNTIPFETKLYIENQLMNWIKFLFKDMPSILLIIFFILIFLKWWKFYPIRYQLPLVFRMELLQNHQLSVYIVKRYCKLMDNQKSLVKNWYIHINILIEILTIKNELVFYQQITLLLLSPQCVLDEHGMSSLYLQHLPQIP